MLQTLKASFDQKGHIHFSEPVHPKNCEVLVTILPGSKEQEEDHFFSSAILSELSLSDWNNEMEESAWAHLQQKISS